MKLSFHIHVDQCRDAGRYHTTTPRGYVEWHEDADRRVADGQRQEQCPTCGLWAVWMTADGRRLKRIAELTECLRWYVENDDTNEGGKWDESNAHWIAKKRRAQRALGMEQEWLDAEACRALGVDRQGSVASWGHGSEAEALVAALENGGGGA